MAKIWVYTFDPEGKLVSPPDVNVQQGDHVFFEHAGEFTVEIDKGLFGSTRFTQNNPCAGPVIPVIKTEDKYEMTVVQPGGNRTPGPRVPPG